MYTPGFENKNYQDGTTIININDTEMTPISEDAVVKYMMGYIMIQKYNLKKGFRIFVEKG